MWSNKILLMLALTLSMPAYPAVLFEDAQFTRATQWTKHRGLPIMGLHCPRDCRAKGIIERRVPVPSFIEMDEVGGTNPSSILCRDMGGIPRIFFEKGGAEVSTCHFEDKSAMLAWDLFRFFKHP